MIGRFVLDASVALSWILPDDSTEQRAYAAAVLTQIEREQPELAVPRVFSVEVVSVMLRACRLGAISQDQLERGISMLEPLRMEIHHQAYDLGELRSLGRYYNLQPHDALYVALARELAVPIAAFDTGIRTACKTFGVDLVEV